MDEVFPELQNMSTVPEAILEIANKGRPCAASAWHNIKSSKLEGTGQCQCTAQGSPRYIATDCSSINAKGVMFFFLFTTHLKTSNLQVLLGGIGDSLLDL